MKLMWLDLETTGLDPTKTKILEVALAEAELLDPFNYRHVYHAIVNLPASEHASLDPFIIDMHTKNGLLAECERSSLNINQVEEQLLNYVLYIVDKEERSVLAGSSISFDMGYLQVHTPRVARRLSHRLYDVSSLKLFCQSQGMPKFLKAEAHRAKDDIDESIAHAAACRAWLRDNLR